MATYQIYVNCTDMGVYEADSARGALEAWCVDAGYKDVTDAAYVVGKSVDAFLSDVEAVEL